MTFIIGQRWISNTESQLGLGIITEVDRRQITLSFPAAEEDRIYAIDNAPLSRILFSEGEDLITNDEQRLTVTNIEEHEGLLFYTGTDESGNEQQIVETQISCFLKLSTPHQRLFSGLLDKLEAFKLRIDSLNHVSRLQQSKVRGLLGSRTNHLPHQVYIANEVAQRYAPRVLLADEVGLGKTIEAGMILHYQLQTGRAQRILIVVPDTLIHQWLVEMIRRFNLYFSIMDQNRFAQEHDYDLDDDEEYYEQEFINENLFEGEQLVLCSIDFLMNNEQARQQALESHWDLLIVDEAHHLHWSVDNKSPEYSCIEELATKSAGLLLLTATPEQVGIQSHFARLRLLDPSRFYDFERFKKEEEAYKKINDLVQDLVAYGEREQTDVLSTELKTKLKSYLGEELSSSIDMTIKSLLDRHGTGRVLFRNTRAAIKGFPKRLLHPYPLPQAKIYPEAGALNPEQTIDNELWLKEDPRVDWLAKKIQELKPQKVLVICALARTAVALEQHLKWNYGIPTDAFHEGLSIIERDRAAAYFAEEEQGAQALICSEIGSEGRNFQFSHHLVLFDLPLNPDLLEQRIGRLDRIGQKHTIEIHVPYLVNTAQETLLRWYNEGINLFENSCSIGFSIYEAFEERLLPLLDKPNTLALNKLIDETKTHTEKINKALNEGRDRLLEMNSCNRPIAEHLIDEIEAEENSLILQDYMAQVFQEYGIEHEYHSEMSEILRPTYHMKTSHFPGLKEEGITITYSRHKALIREDLEFLSWEHPMVYESMEMILGSELGNSTFTTISIKGIAPGTLFLESFFTINCASPKALQLDRFLPLIPIRILMDISGKNLTNVMDYKQLNNLCSPVKSHLDSVIIKQVRPEVESILDRSTKLAESSLTETLAKAQVEMRASLGHELKRLQALKKINPSIRDEEIKYLEQQISESEHYMSNATLKLEALRVVINK